MIALRVILNGTLFCTAGAEDLAVLTTMVAASGNLGTLSKKQGDDYFSLRHKYEPEQA